MPDEVIRVVGTFDASGIEAGMQNAAGATDSAANEMKAQFDALVAKVAALEAALKELQPAADQAAAGVDGLSRAMALGTARAGAMAVGAGGLGLVLGRVAAQSSVLAPILADLFPVLAIGAVVDIMSLAYDKIIEVTDAWAGWNKEAKQTYEELVKSNNAALKFNAELAGQKAALSEIGKEGLAKPAQEEATARAKVVALLAEQREISKEIAADNTKLRSGTAVGGLGAPGVNLSTSELQEGPHVGLSSKDSDQAQAHLADANKQADSIAQQLKEIQTITIPRYDLEHGEVLKKQLQEISLAEIQGNEKVAEAKAAGDKQAAEQAFANQQIDKDKETQLLMDAEDERAAAKQAALERTNAELSKDNAGGQNSAKIQANNSAIEALEVEHQNNLRAIKSAGAAFDLQQEQKNREEDERETREGVQKELSELQRAQNEKMKLAEDDGKTAIAVAERDADAQVNIIKSKVKNLVMTEQQGHNQIAAIYTAEQQKIVTTLNAEIAAEKQLQQSLKDSGAAYSELPAYQQSLQRMKELTDQLAASTDKYKDKLATLDAELGKVTLNGAVQFGQFANSLNAGMNQAIAGWIRGTESFRNGMIKLFGDLLVEQAQFWAKWLMTQAEAWIAAKLLSTQGGAGQGATNVATVTSDAAVAAANTFAAVSAIPVVGPFLAPDMAAASFAQVMAFAPLAAFDHGGIMPEDNIAMLHKNEMVLDPSLSAVVQNAAKGGGGSSGGDTHVHFSPTVHAMDGQSVSRFLNEHEEAFAQMVTRRQRRRNGVG